MKTIYRRLPHEQTEKLMDYADEHNLDYDIWNIREIFTDENCKKTEIGFSQDDWNKLEKEGLI